MALKIIHFDPCDIEKTHFIVLHNSYKEVLLPMNFRRLNLDKPNQTRKISQINNLIQLQISV